MHTVLAGVVARYREGEIVAVHRPFGLRQEHDAALRHGLEPIQGAVWCSTAPWSMIRDGFAQAAPACRHRLPELHLFPHLTVEEEITRPQSREGMASAEARARSRGSSGQGGLKEKIDAYPDQTPGGQQQRVAIARCSPCSQR